MNVDGKSIALSFHSYGIIKLIYKRKCGNKMSYVALYRKWRPRTFRDVVGQEHITTILRNQIMNHRIAHAYLFSGTRGTGKTSTAKIFARAVNCPNGEKGDPCDKCEVCKQIDLPGVMDIIEIDAASNRGVDEIRDLREKVKYPPSIGRYKVYIIDEVHMLTQEAFNALLKTLEEPPRHVIFILATTEPHKLPATILSRCQRFDFKRVSLQDMVARMEYICKEMNISIQPKALELVAKNAEGALRDALSILDQCLSLVEEEETITYEEIIDSLGLASDGWLYDISQSLIQQNIPNTIKFLHQMIDEGKDILQIVKQLTEHFRNILMTKSLSDAGDVLELTQDQVQSLEKQGQNLSEERLFRYIHQFSELENKMKYTSQPTIILEMELIKLCKSPKGNALENLIERISILEKKMEEGSFTLKEPSETTSKSISSKTIREDPARQVDARSSKVSLEKPMKASTLKETSQDVPQAVKVSNLERNPSLRLEDIRQRWEDVLRQTKKKKVQVAALLKEGKPANLMDNQLYIGFESGFGFHQAALAKKENTQLVEEIISKVMGSLIKVKCVMMDEIVFSQEKEKKQETDPVKLAIEVFGEDIVEVVGEETKEK